MNPPRKISRRRFIQEANCAAVGTISLFSSLLSLRLTAGAVSATSSFPDYKALVCLFLNGGNDSFNMLVPRQNDAHRDYVTARGGLHTEAADAGGIALPSADLLPIQSSGQPFTEFGIHPDLPFLQKLYNEGHAAFVANVGTLVEPTTLAQYRARTVRLPAGLFSHSDEQVHWQTLVPQVRGSSPKGWAGRMAERMAQANQNSAIAMNISLSGNNVLQTGFGSIPYITDFSGAVSLNCDDGDPLTHSAVDSLLSQHYQNVYQQTLKTATRNAIEASMAFKTAVDPIRTTTRFPNNATANRLAMISRIMGARTGLGMERQIFFVSRGGWDHHSDIIARQSSLFGEINDSLEAFWTELGTMGLQDKVVIYTASDFARTLSSNGSGSDHAWGGNHFILSGAANGGRIFGQYPTLLGGSNYDIGRGRVLPTTSVDAYTAELASWFGVPPDELSTIIPNATHFFDPRSTPFPLGILGPSLV
jgi:uncharacterized protein (DUF1501 family)